MSSRMEKIYLFLFWWCILLFILLWAATSCTKEAPEPVFEYSVFSEVEVVSSIFDEIKADRIRVLVHTKVNGEEVVVERIAAIDNECPKVRVSGNVIPYEEDLEITLWAEIYIGFTTQDGWVDLRNLSDESLQYIDIELRLGIMDSEFRLSKVIASTIQRSTNTNKEPILNWILPKIETK